MPLGALCLDDPDEASTPRTSYLKITLAIVLGAALVGGLIGAVLGLGLDSGSTASTGTEPTELRPTERAKAPESPEQLYRRDARAVVAISSNRTRKLSALGSGFVVDKRGDIVTNDGVVRRATHIRVGFSGGASYPARLVGADAVTDVAVVRVRASPSALDPLRFGSSAAVDVGDPVYALGDPGGVERTITAGIVSATGGAALAGGVEIADAIVTDAPIDRGDSGGPLLDRFGRVIGIDAASGSGSRGRGLAIPSDTAATVSKQLIERGRAEHASLGIDAETIDSSLRRSIHGEPSHGVAIARVVRGGAAANAGLVGATHDVTVDGVTAPVGGDAIVAIDGMAVRTTQELVDAVAKRLPGDRVTLTVERAGNRRTVTVTLDNGPTGRTS